MHLYKIIYETTWHIDLTAYVLAENSTEAEKKLWCKEKDAITLIISVQLVNDVIIT